MRRSLFEHPAFGLCPELFFTPLTSISSGGNIGPIYVRFFCQSAVGVLRKKMLIEFSRNFGKEAAMTAGINIAKGDAVIIIDADLQDPPRLIPQMVRYWQQGYDVVNMRRNSRAGETFLKKITARLFYRLMALLGPVKMPENVGDFRLLSR